jgi:hypothetical protein
MTDFRPKKKDEEVEEVECGNQRKWKNPLLSMLRRLEPEDCEQKTKRTSVGDIRWGKGTYLTHRYTVKLGLERGLAEKTWTMMWKKGNTAKTATAAAINAIVLEDESTSQMK